MPDSRIDGSPDGGAPRRRIWRIGAVEFDEGRRELRVDGERRALEGKPATLLQALLVRAGEVTTKSELMTAAWGNAEVIGEGSLTTAMSKLRAALGPTGRDVVEVIHGVGYRIAKTVEVQVVYQRPAFAFSFKVGEAVPGRPQWRLEQPLGTELANDVWLARHDKTRERRVFKFADTASRLDSLKREATLSRVLLATLGERPDFARVVEWNFDERPFFIESVYGGPDLLRWFNARGSVAGLSLAERIGLVAQAARSVAAAHGAGVLHSDLKPSNILVTEADADLRVRLVDFGAGGLTEAARTEMLSVSLAGLSDPGLSGRTGTLRYLAPEVLAGAAPTAAADVYALGILLYQMAVGDLDRPLTAGWEADVDDPLLRADIAEAAAGDPSRRLVSAALLAERLERLERRRAEVAREREDTEAAAGLIRQVERARIRRPWAVAASALLAACVIISVVLGARAARERDEAQRQAALANSISAFLTEDVLGRIAPAPGLSEETLTHAATQAEAQIVVRFKDDPMTAATIYQSLAQAFDRRSVYDAARIAYDGAASAFERAEGAGSAGAVIVRLQRAMMEVVAAEPESLDRARAIVQEVAPIVGTLSAKRQDAKVWFTAAKATLQMTGGDVKAAEQSFAQVSNQADLLPSLFSEHARFRFHQLGAFADMRLGRWEEANAALRAQLGRLVPLRGTKDPDVLVAEFTLSQVQMARGQSREAAASVERIRPDVISTFGPEHHLTLQLLGTEAQALGQSGQYGKAVQLELQLHEAAAAKQGEHSFQAIASLMDAAETRCRAGEANEGIANAFATLDDASQSFGKDSALAQAGRSTLGFCLIIGGRYAEASMLLDGIDRDAVAQYTADPDYSAKIDLMQAQIAANIGDSQTYESKMVEPLRTFKRADADPYMLKWTEELLSNKPEAVQKAN